MIFYIFGGITSNDLCRYYVGRNLGLHFVSFVLHWLLYFYFVLAGRLSSNILKRLSSNLSPTTNNPLPLLSNILLLLEPEKSCYDLALTSWLTQGFDDSELHVSDCYKRELVELYWPNRILLLTINRYLSRIGYIVAHS